MLYKFAKIFPIVRFVMLDKLVKENNTHGICKFYEKTDFGKKYQILADILYFSSTYDESNKGEFYDFMQKMHYKIGLNEYFNEDEKHYIRNYIKFHCERIRGVDYYHFKNAEIEFDYDKVRGYIKTTFFHHQFY